MSTDQLEGLKMKCEGALSMELTSQTAINVLLLADTHNAQNLKQSCLVFIAAKVVRSRRTHPGKNLRQKVAGICGQRYIVGV